MRTGYLGLGSNVGDSRGHLRAAIELLRERGVEVEAVSSAYETEPVGEVLDQPDFLNAAIRIRTDLEPEALLDACKAVEAERGRAFDAPRHSPRPLDVDLLLLGDLELETERLTLPHPEVTSRRFVLAPLLELDPELALPDGTASPMPWPRWAPASGPSGCGRSRRLPACRAAARARRAGGSAASCPGSRDDALRQLAGGASSIAGRRSSRVIARPRLGAIWKSAALSCSPFSTPAAIQSSTFCSIAGSSARPRRTCSSSASLKRAERATIGAAVFIASAIGTPELGAFRVAAQRRLVALDRPPEDLAHRGLQLLVAEALGLLDRRPLLGVGREEAAARAAAGPARGRSAASPAPCAPSIFSAGTVMPGKPTARRTPLEITGSRSVRL